MRARRLASSTANEGWVGDVGPWSSSMVRRVMSRRSDGPPRSRHRPRQLQEPKPRPVRPPDHRCLAALPALREQLRGAEGQTELHPALGLSAGARASVVRRQSLSFEPIMLKPRLVARVGAAHAVNGRQGEAWLDSPRSASRTPHSLGPREPNSSRKELNCSLNRSAAGSPFRRSPAHRLRRRRAW